MAHLCSIASRDWRACQLIQILLAKIVAALDDLPLIQRAVLNISVLPEKASSTSGIFTQHRHEDHSTRKQACHHLRSNGAPTVLSRRSLFPLCLLWLHLHAWILALVVRHTPGSAHCSWCGCIAVGGRDGPRSNRHQLQQKRLETSCHFFRFDRNEEEKHSP